MEVTVHPSGMTSLTPTEGRFLVSSTDKTRDTVKVAPALMLETMFLVAYASYGGRVVVVVVPMVVVVVASPPDIDTEVSPVVVESVPLLYVPEKVAVPDALEGTVIL